VGNLGGDVLPAGVDGLEDPLCWRLSLALRARVLRLRGLRVSRPALTATKLTPSSWALSRPGSYLRRLDQSVLERVAHEVRARVQPQFLLDVCAMRLDRAHREEQLLGNLGVRMAQRDQPQDLKLPP
jgi:hypothetical protein